MASNKTGVGKIGEKQEAQLSQRDRVMIRVIAYFAKSLKVIRNDTFELAVYKSLLVFYCNYVHLEPFLVYSE